MNQFENLLNLPQDDAILNGLARLCQPEVVLNDETSDLEPWEIWK